MTLSRFSSILLGSLVTLGAVSAVQARDLAWTGTVQRVWEDGFLLDTGDRSLVVDSWDLCGDLTDRYIATGDRLAVTGEFDSGEFDAFTIADSDGEQVCR